jgi:hypothetical protein
LQWSAYAGGMSRETLEAAARRLDELADRTTAGTWTITGLLASRPEVVARMADGSSQHVAEARAGTAAWITALSPAVAPHLAQWLRVEARRQEPAPDAVALARHLLG